MSDRKQMNLSTTTIIAVFIPLVTIALVAMVLAALADKIIECKSKCIL